MTTLDWIAIAAYAIAVLWLGLQFSDRTHTETDYFLAGRKEGWLPVAASTWATKLSALTFIGVPGVAIAGNFAYMQLWFGSFLAAYVVATLFVREFYRLNVSTVYEYLGLRIGPITRLSGTIIFIVSRCLASAVRLAGCAIAVSVFFDIGLMESIVLIAGVAAAYVITGGLRAVIWTDALQLALFLSGALATIVYVGLVLPDGFAGIVESGMAADKFRVFDFRFDIADPATFWMGNLFAFVLGLATGGADQDIAQRALACPDARQAGRAVTAAGAADIISTALFLSAGVAVFAYYQAFPQDAVTTLIAENRFDYVFPHFIRHELPSGLRGLLVAALLAAAMSSLDSALSGLSSSAYFDLGLTRGGKANGVLKGPRVLVVLFAVVLAAIAVWFGSQPSILWFGLLIMGYTYGGLLGLFAAALFLAKSAGDRASALAAFSSIAVVLIATQWGFGAGPVPWPWAVVIGAIWTFAVAAGAGAIAGRLQTSMKQP
ncbi:MAG: hypothetical protein KJ622_18380 [Alphaproteobacteria bacterium]|nr:hypothetical protein [Alphaproteobacteria bacterium]